MCLSFNVYQSLPISQFANVSTSWGPQTYEKLRSWVPDGDPELQRAWLADYLSAVQWMREKEVPTAPRFDGIMTIGK